MNDDERFGELRSVMHSLRGEARWQAVCALLQDWPVDQLRGSVISSLQAQLIHDPTIRIAPPSWYEWTDRGVITLQHPALSLATGVAWQKCGLGNVTRRQLLALRDVGLTCHALSWDGPVSPLLQLLNARRLTRLSALWIHRSIGDSPLNYLEVFALAQSPHLATLTHLDLNHHGIGDAGVDALVQSPRLARLTSLHLVGNTISPAGALSLAQSPYRARLTSLDLHYNQLRDAGAIALAQSAHLSQLTMLNLGHNRIGDAGARALAQSAHLTGLTTLELGHNPIGDEGAQALASSPYLCEAIRQQWRR